MLTNRLVLLYYFLINISIITSVLKKSNDTLDVDINSEPVDEILKAIDEALNDEEIYDVTVKLLNSLCLCMQEKIRKNGGFQEKYRNITLENNNIVDKAKAWSIYKKIYNKTCLNLYLNKNNTTFNNKSYIYRNTNVNSNNVGDQFNLTGNLKRMKNILQNIFFDTHHKYFLRKYSLFNNNNSHIDIKNKIVIFIITIPVKGSELEHNTEVNDAELRAALSINSTINIDVIDTYNRIENKKLQYQEIFECNLRTIYLFLIKNKNLIKGLSILRKGNEIKIYIEIISNDEDFTDKCCHIGNYCINTNKSIGNKIKEKQYIVTKIENVIEKYNNILFENKKKNSAISTNNSKAIITHDISMENIASSENIGNPHSQILLNKINLMMSGDSEIKKVQETINDNTLYNISNIIRTKKTQDYNNTVTEVSNIKTILDKIKKNIYDFKSANATIKSAKEIFNYNMENVSNLYKYTVKPQKTYNNTLSQIENTSNSNENNSKDFIKEIKKSTNVIKLTSKLNDTLSKLPQIKHKPYNLFDYENNTLYNISKNIPYNKIYVSSGVFSNEVMSDFNSGEIFGDDIFVEILPLLETEENYLKTTLSENNIRNTDDVTPLTKETKTFTVDKKYLNTPNFNEIFKILSNDSRKNIGDNNMDNIFSENSFLINKNNNSEVPILYNNYNKDLELNKSNPLSDYNNNKIQDKISFNKDSTVDNTTEIRSAITLINKGLNDYSTAYLKSQLESYDDDLVPENFEKNYVSNDFETTNDYSFSSKISNINGTNIYSTNSDLDKETTVTEVIGDNNNEGIVENLTIVKMLNDTNKIFYNPYNVLTKLNKVENKLLPTNKISEHSNINNKNTSTDMTKVSQWADRDTYEILYTDDDMIAKNISMLTNNKLQNFTKLINNRNNKETINMEKKLNSHNTTTKSKNLQWTVVEPFDQIFVDENIFPKNVSIVNYEAANIIKNNNVMVPTTTEESKIVVTNESVITPVLILHKNNTIDTYHSNITEKYVEYKTSTLPIPTLHTINFAFENNQTADSTANTLLSSTLPQTHVASNPVVLLMKKNKKENITTKIVKDLMGQNGINFTDNDILPNRDEDQIEIPILKLNPIIKFNLFKMMNKSYNQRSTDNTTSFTTQINLLKFTNILTTANKTLNSVDNSLFDKIQHITTIENHDKTYSTTSITNNSVPQNKTFKTINLFPIDTMDTVTTTKTYKSQENSLNSNMIDVKDGYAVTLKVSKINITNPINFFNKGSLNILTSTIKSSTLKNPLNKTYKKLNGLDNIILHKKVQQLQILKDIPITVKYSEPSATTLKFYNLVTKMKPLKTVTVSPFDFIKFTTEKVHKIKENGSNNFAIDKEVKKKLKISTNYVEYATLGPIFKKKIFLMESEVRNNSAFSPKSYLNYTEKEHGTYKQNDTLQSEGRIISTDFDKYYQYNNDNSTIVTPRFNNKDPTSSPINFYKNITSIDKVDFKDIGKNNIYIESPLKANKTTLKSNITFKASKKNIESFKQKHLDKLFDIIENTTEVSIKTHIKPITKNTHKPKHISNRSTIMPILLSTRQTEKNMHKSINTPLSAQSGKKASTKSHRHLTQNTLNIYPGLNTHIPSYLIFKLTQEPKTDIKYNTYSPLIYNDSIEFHKNKINANKIKSTSSTAKAVIYEKTSPSVLVTKLRSKIINSSKRFHNKTTATNIPFIRNITHVTTPVFRYDMKTQKYNNKITLPIINYDYNIVPTIISSNEILLSTEKIQMNKSEKNFTTATIKTTTIEPTSKFNKPEVTTTINTNTYYSNIKTNYIVPLNQSSSTTKPSLNIKSLIINKGDLIQNITTNCFILNNISSKKLIFIVNKPISLKSLANCSSNLEKTTDSDNNNKFTKLFPTPVTKTPQFSNKIITMPFTTNIWDRSKIKEMLKGTGNNINYEESPKKTNLYPLRVMPKKIQRKVLKRIFYKKPSIEDVFSLNTMKIKQLYHTKSLEQVTKSPNIMSVIPKPEVKSLYLRNNDGSLWRHVKQLDNPNKSKLQNVHLISEPYYYKRNNEFRSKMNSHNNYFYNDNIQSTFMPQMQNYRSIFEITKVPYYRAVPLNRYKVRENWMEDNKLVSPLPSSTRRPTKRSRKTIFFLSPTVPYNRYF